MTFAFFALLLGAASAASPCASELPLWLYEDSKWAPPGYHVLCASGASLELFLGGHVLSRPLPISPSSSFKTLRKRLEKAAKMKRQERWKILPWAIFDTSGARLTSVKDGVLLLFEGGRWVWPGIKEGFERSLPELNATLRTLTLDPLAFAVTGFLQGKKAREIVTFAKPHFKKSNVEMGGGVGEVADARTCSEAWLAASQHPHLEEVAQRAEKLTRVPRKLQEDFRMLRYKKGEQFVAHTDYYEVEDFKDHPRISKELEDGRNWLVTVYGYLSTVEKGGETYFPSSYGGPLPTDLSRCEGPSVKPKVGEALMFYSLHPDSRPNLSSMHGGCKVEKGVKYTVNIWTFNQLKGLTEPDEEDRLPRKDKRKKEL